MEAAGRLHEGSRAARAADSLEPELAARFYDRALQLEPNNTAIMDDYADVLLGVGNVAKASQLLRQSIALAPESGPSKYLNMGQVLEGVEAVRCFERGAALLEAQRARGEGDAAEVRRSRRKPRMRLLMLRKRCRVPCPMRLCPWPSCG